MKKILAEGSWQRARGVLREEMKYPRPESVRNIVYFANGYKYTRIVHLYVRARARACV